jgi:hypothetical protein
MFNQMIRSIFFLVCFLGSLYGSPTDKLFLTWTGDPTSTMTVVWVTEDEKITSEIEYRLAGSEPWASQTGVIKGLPNGSINKWFRVDLAGLKPATIYEFRLKSYPEESFRFRTAPVDLSNGVEFVVGGDVYHGKEKYVVAMNRAASKRSPLFAVVGGDLAYSADRSGNKRDDEGRWMTYLKLWHSGMVTPAGELIPMLPLIGNHEVIGRYDQPISQAPFFYALFPTPGEQGYGSIDFGNYLSVLLLDSGHTHPIKGEQTAWLKNALEARREVSTKIAVYHVPAYPSYRKLPKQTVMIRENWLPLFDQYGLAVAFENHDHCFKRTLPLKGGKVDPAGVLYLGDGAWGVKPRKVGSKKGEKGFGLGSNQVPLMWYMEKVDSLRHVWHVRLEPNKRIYQAVNEFGDVFDQAEQVRVVDNATSRDKDGT